MEFDLTVHALEQMAERMISEEMIDEGLSNPVRMPATTRGTRYDGVVSDGRTLTVVVDDARRRLKIVTVWWTEQG